MPLQDDDARVAWLFIKDLFVRDMYYTSMSTLGEWVVVEVKRETENDLEQQCGVGTHACILIIIIPRWLLLFASLDERNEFLHPRIFLFIFFIIIIIISNLCDAMIQLLSVFGWFIFEISPLFLARAHILLLYHKSNLLFLHTSPSFTLILDLFEHLIKILH